MKTPDGLIKANGKPANIVVHLKGGDEQLKEYTKDDQSVAGGTIKCFVLTAPRDVISVDIKADADTADVFDLEVDGILRASVSGKLSAKINKVCFKGKTGNKRSGAKYCGMQVKDRDPSSDSSFVFDENPSAVGSLVIKALRKNEPEEPALAEDIVQPPKVPSYEEYASWQDQKGYITKEGREGPLPPFEIDFINQTPLDKKVKEKVDEVNKRNPQEFTLVATFVFNLQSAANLTALGFENVPTWNPKPLQIKAPRVKKTKKAETEADAEDEDKGEDANDSIVVKAGEKSSPEPEMAPKAKPKANANSEKKKSEPKPKPEPKAKSKSKTKLPAPEPSKTTTDSKPKSKPKIGKEDKPDNTVRSETGHSLAYARVKGGLFGADSEDEEEDTSVEKPLVLHGEKGNPAHQAFLARAATEEPESRVESEVDPSELSEIQASVVDSIKDLPAKAKASLELLVGASISDNIDSPDFELLTPPISSKKPISRPALAASITERLSQVLPQTNHFSQATTASTNGTTTKSDLSAAKKQQQTPLNQTIVLDDDSQPVNLVRAPSPALSEVTEVADPQEILDGVKKSRRIGDNSYEFQYQYSQPEENSQTAYHTLSSPVLGAVKSADEDVSMLDISGVHEQVLEQTPLPTTRTALPDHRPTPTEKRKAAAISGGKKIEEPRKSVTAPAARKTGSIEEQESAAKAEIAALEEEKRKLDEAWEAAMAEKKKRDAVIALKRNAEELKRANKEKRAQIEALQRSNEY